MNGDERNDERIGRLLAASRASANPAVLARARARLAARESNIGLLAFLGRPAALATACALLVVSGVLSLAVVRSERVTTATAATTSVTLVSALLGDDGTYGVPSAATAADASTPGDSGGVQP
jgi:hypothetical protein